MGSASAKWVSGAMKIAATVLLLGCGARTALPICGTGTNDIICLITDRDKSKEVCNCACNTIVGNFDAAVPVCLPDNVNSLITDAGEIAKIDPDIYANALETRCKDLASAINAIPPMFIDSCGFLPSFCTCALATTTTADGGTEPFLTLNSSCVGCDASVCTVGDGGNCKNPLLKDGGLDISRCNCNQVNTCGNTGQILCRPTAGSGDPPETTFGLLPGMIEGQSDLEVDPTKSTFTITFSATDDSGTVYQQVTPTIHGRLATYGWPKSDGSADVLFDFAMNVDDTSFTVGSTNVSLTEIVMNGGTGTVVNHFGTNGIATISAGQLSLVIDFTQNGTPSRLMVPSSADVVMSVDRVAKTFSIPSISFDTHQGVTGTISVAGKIANQPPLSRAGDPQIVECTSPAGASVTLDGSASTDPDNNILGISWATGEGLDPYAIFSKGSLTTTTTAPIGSTDYTLSLLDGVMQGQFDTTNVTVRDTTPPNLTLSASPSCLWPADKKFVLFQLGLTLGFTATDTCDPTPTVTVLGVTSDQPAPGEIVFGPNAVCLQANSDPSSTGRNYTVTVQAKDKYGNTTTKNIVINVPHDQSGTSCPKVDKSRIVTSSDSRCTQ